MGRVRPIRRPRGSVSSACRWCLGAAGSPKTYDTAGETKIASLADLGTSKPVIPAATRWSCARCDVSVGRMDGEPIGLPDTWTRPDGECFCLSCSRARAGEAAIDLVPDTTSLEDRVRVRRTALIEFEIDRMPAATDRAIATACRTSSGAVAAVRGALVSPGADAPELPLLHSA
jgi:hypothetical protein